MKINEYRFNFYPSTMFTPSGIEGLRTSHQRAARLRQGFGRRLDEVGLWPDEVGGQGSQSFRQVQGFDLCLSVAEGIKAPKYYREMKKQTVYAFIDSQNLNLGTSKDIRRNKKLIYRGWKLDFKKFRQYLANKFRVKKAFLFIGYIPQNKKLYQRLKSFGYQLIFKPTTKDRLGKAKGNVDAELVLHAVRIEYDNYDKAVIVSGDGDFYCLYKFLKKQGKLLQIIIPNRKSESSLLKTFQSYKIFLIREKDKLELKP